MEKRNESGDFQQDTEGIAMERAVSVKAPSPSSSSPTHLPKANGASMEMNGDSITTPDQKIDYKGWRVMPFIIGTRNRSVSRGLLTVFHYSHLERLCIELHFIGIFWCTFLSRERNI